MHADLPLLGIGIYMIGRGVTAIANPGAYGMIAGGIICVVAALV